MAAQTPRDGVCHLYATAKPDGFCRCNVGYCLICGMAGSLIVAAAYAADKNGPPHWRGAVIPLVGAYFKVAQVRRYVGVGGRNVQRIGGDHALAAANAEVGRGVDTHDQIKNAVVVHIAEVNLGHRTSNAARLPLEAKAHAVPYRA